MALPFSRKCESEADHIGYVRESGRTEMGVEEQGSGGRQETARGNKILMFIFVRLILMSKACYDPNKAVGMKGD